MMSRRKLHSLRGASAAVGGIEATGMEAAEPSDVRKLADAARKARIWWLDAYYRRVLCGRSDATADDWLQYGHALKEAGRFGDAADAYRFAATLSPEDTEVALQTGHLLKVAGYFEEAAEQYRAAAALPGGNIGEIERELKLLRAAAEPARIQFDLPDDHRDIHFFLSSAQSLFDETSAAGLAGLGGRDYSYAFAMRNFCTALDALDIDYTLVPHPEFVPDAGTLIGGGKAVHLGFYPPERIRVLKGAYNVICFAWEFERLRSPQESGSYHAFADQATMLAVADELWVPSSEGAATVAAAVARPVYHVPAPIIASRQRKPRAGRIGWREMRRPLDILAKVVWQPLAVVPRLQATMNNMAVARQVSLGSVVVREPGDLPPTLFVTVLNVHDFRKQLRPMLEGFLQFLRHRSDAYLLIKLTTPDRGKLTINEFIAMDQLSDPARLIPPMVSEKILIADAFLTAAELAALYDVASFYCCTSYAEGQNLPLLEAMSHGVVPVSVDVTAMADYVDSDNGVIINSTRAPADHRLTDRYGMIDFTLAHVSPDDVEEAIGRACELDGDAYARKSALARRTVEERFSVEVVRKELDRLTASLQDAWATETTA